MRYDKRLTARLRRLRRLHRNGEIIRAPASPRRNERHGVDANSVGQHERVAGDIEGLRAALERLERSPQHR